METPRPSRGFQSSSSVQLITLFTKMYSLLYLHKGYSLTASISAPLLSFAAPHQRTLHVENMGPCVDSHALLVRHRRQSCHVTVAMTKNKHEGPFKKKILTIKNKPLLIGTRLPCPLF